MHTWTRLREVGLVLILLAVAGLQAQTTNVWDGSGNASDAANWSLGVVPLGTHHILLDDSSAGDMTWDAGVNGLPDTVASWTQTEDYTGTVTIDTRFPGQGDFQVFTVSGAVLLEGGQWTHVAQPNSDTASQRLRVHVEGNLNLGSNAAINVTAKGFPRNRGPGKGDWDPINTAVHGGSVQSNSRAPYGSVFEPVDLGSGGSRSDNDIAGGAVHLVVDGAAVIDGDILANGRSDNRGSGGAIYLRADALSGQGLMSASSGTPAGAGGSGGRIAVILDSGSDFGDITMRASGSAEAAAGTVYVQTAAQGTGEGRLIIDSDNRFARNETTYIPGGLDYSNFTEVVVRGMGNLGITDADTFDFAAVNLDGAGAANNAARITLLGMAGVSMPDPFEIEGYTLVSRNTFTNYTGHLHIRSTGGLSHARNPNSTVYRLFLDIDGDLTIDTGGAINLDRCGYGTESSGPVTGSSASWSNPHRGASHGGRGMASGTPYGNTYGSIYAPDVLGAAGIHGTAAEIGGGGAGILTVTGTTTLNGEMSARGGGTSRGASGGSVFLTTGYLVGNGSIDVRGRDGSSNASGGGRIAVVLTAGDGFDSVTMTAQGGHHTTENERGSAGTVYRQTATQLAATGTITASNPHATAWHTAMLLPASYPEAENYGSATLRIDAHGRVLLTDDVQVANLVVDGTNARLDLNGKILHLRTANVNGSPIGTGEFSAADLGFAQIIDSDPADDGRIIILPAGTFIILR